MPSAYLNGKQAQQNTMNCLKYIIFLIGKITSLIYPYKLHRLFGRIWTQLYSGWILPEFSSCGPGFSVEYPIIIIGGSCITLGSNFRASERLRIECWEHYGKKKYRPSIRIGDNVGIGYNVHIGCINKIEIGNNVLLASNVFIEDCYHGFADSRDIGISPGARELFSKGAVCIEEDVWVGENVAILPNVTIGRGSIIGANAVVSKDIPPYSIAAGNPARVIRRLDTGKRLENRAK